jgi:hypothetical protein
MAASIHHPEAMLGPARPLLGSRHVPPDSLLEIAYLAVALVKQFAQFELGNTTAILSVSHHGRNPSTSGTG